MQTHYKIEAHADWIYVMTNFVSRYNAKDGNDVTVEVGTDIAVWHINRNLIPASDLAKLFGVDEIVLADDVNIILEPLDGWTSDIVPTVNYIGHG